MLPADQATTKGAILRGLLKFLQSDLTSEQYEHAVAALPSADQAVVRQRSILPSQKVSEFILNRLTVEAAKVKGENIDKFGRRAGAAELRESVGIYRFITFVLTPPALLKKASTIWSTVHSHGALTVVEQTENSARVRLTDFPSEEANCSRITGWMEGLGTMTGVRNTLAVHDLCMTRGAKACEWLVSWTKK
ncbi:MAG: hypothetical protein ABI837_18555 [Acidobacteriota bacterium]